MSIPFRVGLRATSLPVQAGNTTETYISGYFFYGADCWGFADLYEMHILAVLMGELTIGYVDPYIRSASSRSANPNSYTLMSYSTGRITLSFLPDKLVY